MAQTPEQKAAAAAYGKVYREANKEKIAARKKAYCEANKEKEATRKNAYYEATKEKYAERKKAYRKKWLAANKEKVAARCKAYHEANKEKMDAYKKAWYAANPLSKVKSKAIRYFVCVGIPADKIPEELVQLKVKQILLGRKLKKSNPNFKMRKTWNI